MAKRASMNNRMVEPPRGASEADRILIGRERERQEVVELLVREIMPNRQQPRSTFNRESLTDLAASIQLHGVLEPVIVRIIPLTNYEDAGRQYELIAGERRWRACMIATRETIPALVLPETTTDRMALELAITENLQREDLHPVDEAIAFERMQRELGYSYAQIGERLGKSKGYVQNRLRLLQLDEDLLQLVIERPDTLTHVYELAKVTDREARQALIRAVREDALSLKETRARIQAILEPPVEESYLYKYDSGEFHEESTAGDEKSYFQKYDSGEFHEESTTGDEKSHLRKYDSGINHNISSPTDTAITSVSFSVNPSTRGERGQRKGEVQTVSASSDALLTDNERATLRIIIAKVDHLLDGDASFVNDDWDVLGQLALRLSELLRHIGQSRDTSESHDSPDTPS